jgi:hypothetical protein
MFQAFSFAVFTFLASLVDHPPMLKGGEPNINTEAACVITRDYGDSAWASCDDGTQWYWDADGQLRVNLSGTPLRLPGWQEEVR